jgi:hypothetical protein
MRRNSTTVLPEEAAALLQRRQPNPRVVAQNIIRKYGKNEFQLLIQLFQDNAPTKQVMALYLVTRQRVAQWREALGIERVVYDPHPQIVDLLPRPLEPRSSRRTAA